MITLDRLAGVLGGYGATLCSIPAGRDVELHSVTVHDSTNTQPGTGDVYLAVGLNCAVEAVEAAIAARARALLLRGDPDPEALTQAENSGIALLAVDPALSWSQLAAVVYGLVLEGQDTESGRGPTDLFTVADSLARTVGAPLTVEDHHSRVLAYSSSQYGADRARTETILGRTVPAEIRAALATYGVFEHLATSDEPLFVPASAAVGLDGREVIAVRAGRTMLGSIWVEVSEPLDAQRRAALVAGTATAALHLLRVRASADLERQFESDCVTRLLDGDTDTLALLGSLGLPHGSGENLRVIAIGARNEDAEQAAALLTFERATLGFGWARPGRSALLGNTVYTIMPGSADPSPALRWVNELVSALPAATATSAGIGAPAAASELLTSRREAEEGLAVHALRPAGRTALAYDDSWEEILLVRLRGAASAGREPARGPLAELRTHDERHGTRFVTTLHAWLRAQGDVAAAAAELSIHRNTVRYRMQQMATIADIDLDDPDRRVALLIMLEAAS